jgi:hypothetical protein
MWQKNYCATCHNIEPSIIIIDDGDQYLKKNYSNFFHNATCQVWIDGWKLLTLAWHYGCSCNGIA